MKMNNKMKAVVKIVEGLIFIAIGLSMVGCEEAKEVENLNIQDTNPLIEQAKDLQEELEANDEYNEAIKNYIATNGQDQEALRGAVGVALDKANETKVVENAKCGDCGACVELCECGVTEEAPTAMTAEEFDNAKCENCGHDVSDVIDNAGGYWCEACDYVK